ncbi:glutamate receptor ionotropic, kainate 2-like isoform X2 [Homarus americanus]|uniref:glutamate receptor ionotropic, kainate 2-like isoform X2 n=1 Tax=Homarus americanus TaxID=6706 RepID=UPI001C439685|nr:glutamate receptor ionotropic, kainate 2-like isoform X2 [Homarus americanus]
MTVAATMNTAATVTAAVAIVAIGMTAGATDITAATTGMTADPTNSSPCLKICGVLNYPHLDVDNTTIPYTMRGSIIKVLDIVTTKLNMCYEWVLPDLLSSGYKLPNGSWDGAMGLLTRQKCEMIGTAVPVNHVRFQAADFSTPLYMEYIVIAHQRPVIAADLAGFIWLFILLTMIAVGVVIFFIEWEESLLYPQQSDSESDGGKSYGSVGPLTVAWTSCLWTLGAAIAHSSTWSPQRDSVRVLSGLWLLMSVILGIVYRCNLKAMLIMPKITYPFNSLEELMQTDIPVYIPEGNLIHQFVIFAPPGSLLHKINDRLITHFDEPRAVRDTSGGIQAAITTNSIMAHILHTLFSMTNSCPMYIASEPVFTAVSTGFAYAKGSPLRETFDPILRRLVEFGIVQHAYDNAVRNGTVCFKPESFTRPNNSLRPLELGDFYGVFAVYAGGMLLASVVLLVEVTLKGRQRLQGNRGV